MSDSCQLPGRGLVMISGEDRRSFLQGLITNDVHLLDRQKSMYSCLLTSNGKFKFDFFITEEKGQLLLDCEGGARAEALAAYLEFYKLRARINLDFRPEQTVFAVLEGGSGTAWPDPRHEGLGLRSFETPQNGTPLPFETWDERRIKLCVPDGSRDMVPERATLLESNLDRLNAISWEKGCYLGQELTARMYYRGLAKKHLYAVEFSQRPPAPGTPLMLEGKTIGEMRSSCGNIGLALLKDQAVHSLPTPEFRLLRETLRDP